MGSGRRGTKASTDSRGRESRSGVEVSCDRHEEVSMWHRSELLGRDFAGPWSHRGVSARRGNARPRILVEEPDPAEGFAYWRLLTKNGYDVSWCPGPTGQPRLLCPLVTRGRCDLVQCADVVVSSLPLHRESSQKVIAAIRNRYPDTVLLVQAPQRLLAQCGPSFEDRSWRAMRMPVTSQTVLDSVERALEARDGGAVAD